MVYATHMSAHTAVTVDSYAVGEFQAQQAIDFMATAPAGEPRVLIGDLNQLEDTKVVCGQILRSRPLAMLREAGYLDAWPAVHGLAEGFTGMWNRQGCGSPEGYLWKRIDYAWSLDLNPLGMTRFGMSQAGQCALSDHAGIIVAYPLPGQATDLVAPAVTIVAPVEASVVSDQLQIEADASDDVAVTRLELLVDGLVADVRHAPPFVFTWNARTVPNGVHALTVAASDAAGNRTISAPRAVGVQNPIEPFDETIAHAVEATSVAGGWTLAADATAAGGYLLQSNDNGQTNSFPATSPVTYVEFSFYANAGKPYRIWLRGRAQQNSALNDTVYLQFDGSVDLNGVPKYRLGTAQGAALQFEECDGCGLDGWAWADNGFPRDVLGAPIYFASSGPQRLRVQVKEDGVEIDQVVISAVAHFLAPPGRVKSDTTVLPSSSGGQGPPPPTNSPPGVALISPVSGTMIAPAAVTLTAAATDSDGTVARVDFYSGPTQIGSALSSPFTVSWTNVAAGSYTITARAVDNMGATTVSTPVTLQVLPAPPVTPSGPLDEIVLHAAAATNIAGNWQLTPDVTAASGVRIQNTNLNIAKVPVAPAPAHAFDVTVEAQSGRPYHLWLRMKVLNDYYGNDSVYVQFDGSVDVNGMLVSRIGTTAAET